MTTASGDIDPGDVPSGYAFTLWTAGEVRSCMARVGVRPAELSRRLGVSHQWVSTRLNGKVPMTTADLARIAAVLGLVSPLALFAGGSYPPGPDGPTIRTVNEPTSSATSARNRAAGRWFSQVTGDVAERDVDLLPTG